MLSDNNQNKHPAADVVRQCSGGFRLICFLSFFTNLSVLISPIYMQQIFDRVLQTQAIETLFFLTLIVLVFIAFFSFLDILRARALARIGRWWDETLRSPLLAAAMKHAQISGRGSSSIMTDLQVVRGFVGGPSILPFFDAPFMPFFLIVIAILHPWLGILALVAALVLLGLAFMTERFTQTAARELADRQQRLNGLTISALRQVDAIHAMGMGEGIIKRYSQENAPTLKVSQQLADSSGMVGGLTKFVRMAVQILVLALGAYLVTRAELTSGGMIAASIILGRALAPAEQAIGAWKGFAAAREAHGRILEILNAAPPEAAKTQLPEAKGEVSLEGVSFVLPGTQRFIVRGVTMKIKPGSVVALVGGSASGKSTLCRLIVGALRPTTGIVRIDGAAVGDIAPEQLSRTIGYLAQSVEFLGGTIRDNIARFTNIADEAVVAAAQLANCHEMILRLPNGYQTEIGDSSVGLSGGQRQRIGLARALLGLPRLVVLDEPNANLDSEGDQQLVEAIKALKQAGVTVIMVSHRMTQLSVIDYFATIKDGQLEKFEDRETAIRGLMRNVTDLSGLRASAMAAFEAKAAPPALVKT